MSEKQIKRQIDSYYQTLDEKHWRMASRAIYEEYYPLFVNLLSKRLGSKAVAEECVQAAVFTLISRIKTRSFKNINIKGFLYRTSYGNWRQMGRNERGDKLREYKLAASDQGEYAEADIEELVVKITNKTLKEYGKRIIMQEMSPWCRKLLENVYLNHHPVKMAEEEMVKLENSNSHAIKISKEQDQAYWERALAEDDLLLLALYLTSIEHPWHKEEAQNRIHFLWLKMGEEASYEKWKAINRFFEGEQVGKDEKKQRQRAARRYAILYLSKSFLSVYPNARHAGRVSRRQLTLGREAVKLKRNNCEKRLWYALHAKAQDNSVKLHDQLAKFMRFLLEEQEEPCRSILEWYYGTDKKSLDEIAVLLRKKFPDREFTERLKDGAAVRKRRYECVQYIQSIFFTELFKS